jgi:hypothetical protein
MSANDSSSQPPSTRLSYTIAGCSEHSNRYVAENIMVDAPTDPNSRWSGQHESPSIKQWILLRLDTLSVIGEFFDSPNAELLLRPCLRQRNFWEGTLSLSIPNTHRQSSHHVLLFFLAL